MAGLAHDAQLSLGDRRLARATKALVKAVGGQEEASEIVRVRQQKVSDWGLPNVDCFIDIKSVAALEEEARGSDGWPQVTRALARGRGFELLPTPASGPGGGGWHKSAADLSREAGRLVSLVIRALDGGTVTPAEIRHHGIAETIDDALAILCALKGLALAGEAVPVDPAGGAA